MKEDDRPKTTFRSRYVHDEYVVISFEGKSATSMFMDYMNKLSFLS